jgi:rhodanese-related sulfurtransferase
MTIKILFDPADGRILGAQVVGGAGVDKRIDVLAVAIQAQMTVFDLEEAELAYAPQFGSAKDPVNMAGFVAAGEIRGDHPQIGVASLQEAQDAFLMDVRSPKEFATGSIAGAINIPIDELRSRVGELPKNRRIVTYCLVGQRGYLATRILRQAGYDAVNLSGGYKTFMMHVATNSAWPTATQ